MKVLSAPTVATIPPTNWMQKDKLLPFFLLRSTKLMRKVVDREANKQKRRDKQIYPLFSVTRTRERL